MGRFILVTLLVACLSGCGGGIKPPTAENAASPGDGTPQATQADPGLSVKLAWNANREKAVNSAGGGYRVYYATKANFALTDGKSVDVPSTGGSAPTQTKISGLVAGEYHFKIVAYSAITPTGSTSIPSTEATITVP